MYQFILEQALSPNDRKARLYTQLRNQIIKIYDPIVHYDLNNKRLLLNLSHQLPFYRRQFPTYSANLTRLTSFIRTYFGKLLMIDVGANIGDSFCLAAGNDNDQYLLIEGDEHFFTLLTRNTQQARNVKRVRAFLSNDIHSLQGQLISNGGTGHLVSCGSKSDIIHYHTLDEIVKHHFDFHQTNLLKTDVEGYDCKVLMGAKRLITTSKPIIFFEHSPQHLDNVRENYAYIFEQLAQMQYHHLIFYDNFGFLIGLVQTSNTSLINDLMFYARQRDGYYYDICCFHDEQKEALYQFFKHEKDFYVSKMSNSH